MSPTDSGLGIAGQPDSGTAMSSPPEITADLLPVELENIIDSMIRKQMYVDVETDKTLWYAQARKCLLYWSGKQWLTPVFGPDKSIVDYQPFNGTNQASPTSNETPVPRGRYDTIENYVRGDGNKFCAVLGEKSPNPKVVPLDTHSPDADARAKLADRILLCVRRLWNVEEVHRLLVLSAWRDGTFFLYTPWEADAEKYGMVIHQEMQMEKHVIINYSCMHCGNVQVADVTQPPTECNNCHNQQLSPSDPQEMDVPKFYDVRSPGAAPGLYDSSFYEVTLPFYTNVQQFDRTPWLIHEDEVHRGTLLEQYPILWEKCKGNVESSEWPDNSVSQTGFWSRNMRATINTDMREAGKYRWIKSMIWMRPSQYNMLGNQEMPGGDQSGQSIKVRDWFKQNFPTGCKLTRVGRWIVDIKPETLSWHWSVGVPMISKTINCDPISLDFLQIQDAVNSVDNLFQENMERNIPITLVNANLINTDALRNRPGIPGELFEVEGDSLGEMKNALYNLPTAQLDGQNFGYRNQILEAGREITGVTKAIFGASNASTAHEAELQKTQAMLQLGLVWKGLQNCWQGAYTNALRMLACYGADVLQNWGLSKTDVQDAAGLVDPEGNLNGVRVSVEEGIPATWGQIRDAVMFLIQQNPGSWPLSGLNHPSNAANLQDALGIPNWITPGSSARDYILKLIKRLLAGQVTQPPIDPNSGQPQIDPTGMPMQPQPSEMIDQLVLPTQLGIPLIQEWMMSDEGMEAAAENAPGFGNLHLAFQIYSAPPPMPGPPNGGPNSPGPGGPNGPPPPGPSEQGNAGTAGPGPPPGQGAPPTGPASPGQQAHSQPGRLQLVHNMGKR